MTHRQIAAVFDGNANLKQHYVYDGPQIISAFSGSGSLEWEAVWGQQIDQLYAFRDVANSSGQLVPLTDHRNSIVGTFSSTLKNIDQMAEYDPHGRVTLRNSAETVVCEEAGNAGIRCDAPSGLPFGFASALRSDVTGLVYMRNRWYSPRLGQFITHDPLGYVDTHNLYAYVAFDPINFLDPWGLNKEGGLGGNGLLNKEEQEQFLKFATSRDPNRQVDPSDLLEGALKQVGNDVVDNARMGKCLLNTLSCIIDTHQNGVSPPVFKFDNPDQEMAGNMVFALSAVSPNPGRATKLLGPAVGWFGRMVTKARKAKKLKKVNKIPDGNEANHIFSGRPQKFQDTPANREMIYKLANDPNNLKMTDKFGKDLYTQMRPDGTQAYAYTRNGVIKGAGINDPPRTNFGGDI